MGDNTLDFLSEDLTDEEANEIFDMVFIKPIADAAGIYMEPKEILAQIEKEENTPAVVNPNKIAQMQVAYKILKQVGKSTGAKVTYKLNKPFVSMGSISITGKNIYFKDPEWLFKLSKLASNIDMYPRADGNTTIDFTFHGLTSMIK